MKKRLTFVTFLSLLLVLAGAMAYAAGTLSKAEEKFMKAAAGDNMFEIEMGKVAQDKAASQDVKDFGSRMVTDHGKANDELKTIAQQKNVTLPDKLEGKNKSTYDKLSKLTGDKFDKEYMSDMVKDHKEDVALFKKEQKKIKDPDLKGWVDKTLPVIEDHLKLAKDTAKKVGAK